MIELLGVSGYALIGADGGRMMTGAAPLATS